MVDYTYSPVGEENVQNGWAVDGPQLLDAGGVGLQLAFSQKFGVKHENFSAEAQR